MNTKKVLLVVLVAALVAMLAYTLSNSDLRDSGKASLFNLPGNADEVMAIPTPPGYFPQIQNLLFVPAGGYFTTIRNMLYSLPTPPGYTPPTEYLGSR